MLQKTDIAEIGVVQHCSYRAHYEIVGLKTVTIGGIDDITPNIPYPVFVPGELIRNSTVGNSVLVVYLHNKIVEIPISQNDGIGKGLHHLEMNA